MLHKYSFQSFLTKTVAHYQNKMLYNILFFHCFYFSTDLYKISHIEETIKSLIIQISYYVTILV